MNVLLLNNKHVSLYLYCLQSKHEHLFMSVSNICWWSVSFIVWRDSHYWLTPPILPCLNCLQWIRHPFLPSRASVKGPDSRRTAVPTPGWNQDEWRGRATRRGRLMISEGLKGEREKESGQEVCRNKPGTRRRLNDAHTAVWVVKRLQESKEERERERERESQRSNGHSSKMCTVKITVIHSSVFVIKPYVFIHEHVICIWIPYLDNFLPVVSILLCSFCLH